MGSIPTRRSFGIMYSWFDDLCGPVGCIPVFKVSPSPRPRVRSVGLGVRGTHVVSDFRSTSA